MQNSKLFICLALILLLASQLYSQQNLNPSNYITVDNLNDNNTGANGTILCDTSYCETGPNNPVAGDNNGWWSQIDVASISYNGTVRLTPRSIGVQRPNGSKATFFFNASEGGNYLVYTYLFASGNASSNAYITFRRFGEGTFVDSFRYDQNIHQIGATGTAGGWYPWRVINIAPGFKTLEVTIGADTLTQPYMRADASRILRSTNSGPDLEFGRRSFSQFDSVRVVENFPQINFKFREYFDKKIKLFNLGTTDLTVSNISFTTSRFSCQTTVPIVIAPGESRDVTVRFSPKGEEVTLDSMKIMSNDLAEPIAYLPLKGEGINYNFIMNASANGSEPHWNAPAPANYSEILSWSTSTGRSPFVFPIAGGNLTSRYYPSNIDIPVASYKFQLPDTLSGSYILEYGGPYSANSTQTAVFQIVTPFISDTIKIRNFNQNIPFGGDVWKRVADNQTRVFNLNGGGQSTVNITRTEAGSGVLRADLLRIRLLPIAPTASTSADNDGRQISIPNVSIYDSIRLSEFNYQKTLQIRSNGEQPLIVDSISLIGRDKKFFKIENIPVQPLVLPSIDGTYNLIVSFLPKDTIIYDTTWNQSYNLLNKKDSLMAMVDTIIGGIRNYNVSMRMKTNDTINNKYITISLRGNGVGNIIIIDDSDPTTFTNTNVIDWNPILPTEINKWQRVLGAGTNNTRLFSYIYGYQYVGITPDSNYIEWFPKIPKRPNGPNLEVDSFNVYAILPTGSSTSNPRAVYEISSPITGIHRILKNQNSTAYGGEVPSSGRLFLGKYSFFRGGQDIHGGGTIFGNIKLINNFSEVTDFYKDSLVNSAMADSFVTRADAIVLEQVSKILNIKTDETNLPLTYYIKQNYPNPFNPSTKIQFGISSDCHVTVIVYDCLGREVVKLVDESKKAGNYYAEWNSKNKFNELVSSGIYLCRIKADNFVKTIKMLLIK